jgi:hypothetical protein
MKVRMLLPIPLLLLPALIAGAAQPAEVPEYLFKSIMLKKVSDFVEWPGGDPSRPFVIGVLGRSPFGDHLSSVYAKRPIKGRSVRILQLSSPEEAAKVDLLFICASEKPRVQAIVAKVDRPGILTIGDAEGYAQAGVMVNVRMREGSPYFELNLRSLRRATLTVDPHFVRIAREVIE